MDRVAIFFFWMMHWLPQPALAFLGRSFGKLAFFLARERRDVAIVNLRACMPELNQDDLRLLVKQHFMALGRMATEWTVLWWGSEKRLRKMVRIEHLERLIAYKGTPVILLAPHFVGLDMCGVRLSMEMTLCTMYTQQKNRRFTELFLHGRMRFNPDNRPFSRQEGIRPLLRALKENIPAYFLPDQDAGREGAVFVPFFGQLAATLTSLSRLAKAGKAVVIPAIPRQVKGGYVLEIGEAWKDFPNQDVTEDTRRMNQFIESVVRTMPEQYFWVHKRFKTQKDPARQFYVEAFSALRNEKH